MKLSYMWTLALILLSCTKAPEQKQTATTSPMSQEFCMEKDCNQLEESGYDCFENKKAQACQEFIDTFEKLVAPYNCNGKIDPNLNINNCGQRKGATYVDVHFKRLSELDDPKAIALYASERFRKVLDGNAAEEHREKSLKQEMILNPKLLPKGYKAECIEYERSLQSTPVIKDFKQYKKSEFSEYQINDYKISLGQFGISITQNNKECHTKIEGEVRDAEMEKFKQFDIVKIASYGFEKRIETIVDLKTCKVLWKAEMYYESLEMNSAPEKILVKESSFTACDSCWNKNTRECKRY